ncbi:uncharacterized protein LOC122084031 [Macadamia integrifolia]|uniref:uncharacterized protein LOC122084031 n=1 Tax=Macadamia integrifolia TaxID=60698 RepID=UPI001C5004E0|nr:uncharacterized protein LOC122084031 [Macadamia integrifolia]XP_042507960.1 uncharacterized protein LOC122084031 [Macadamia integrifolia]
MTPEGKKKEVGPAAEASSRPLASKTGDPKSLKPKRKIVKKSSNQNSLKKKDSTAAQIEGKPNNEKNSTPKIIKEKNAINQTKDDKKKNSQEMNKGKSIINEKSVGDRKDKEELGGLIFMCNGKTKPDCFRYGIMGVPLSQKELVMGIKPGLNLFLYDFDLKLMYGIYKASSAGGMKLEPAAFGGAFPVQVRFKVHKDCFPLPEGDFKSAIKDNYEEKKKKFKTQLTVLQVKKLTSLFQTSPHVQSNSHFIQAPPPPQIQAPSMPILPAGKVSEGGIELPHHAIRETFMSDPYFLDGGRRYLLPSDNGSQWLSREPVLTHREVAIPKEEPVHLNPQFMTEKEYRTYGLSRERHTLSPSASMDRNAPIIDMYKKNHEREQLPQHVSPRHQEIASRETDQVRHDPLFLSEKDYRAYGLGQKSPLFIPQAAVANSASRVDTYAKDPYYPHHYGSTSSGTYPSVPRGEARRDTCLTKSDYQERGSTDFSGSAAVELGGYSRFASNGLSEYNERHQLASTSVSSRYSFDGPSLTYR